MNCAELFADQVRDRPHAPALWMSRSGVTTFSELHELAARVQRSLTTAGVTPGSSVLLIDSLSPRLYAAILATLALGATVVFAEPWMDVPRLDRVVDSMSPRAFLHGWIGVPWGARVPAIRRIPRWLSMERSVRQPGGATLRIEDVPPETPGLIGFSSGTTGQPKGAVRGHGFLMKQLEVLRDVLRTDGEQGADLCIFANFALLNLAAGRPSVVMPSRWTPAVLRTIDELPDALQPTTLTCGPAFLHTALLHSNLSRLHAVHIGGAQIDNAVFERGFARWPHARSLFVYGSSEAEPVAAIEARDAVRASRERGYFQTLCLGRPIEAIRADLEPDTVWVAGPHVCPMYVGNTEENAIHKRRDEHGVVWHDMGDRVIERHGLWWYAGRSRQPLADFELEQQVYSVVGSSASFIHRDRATGATWLVGEGLEPFERSLRARFPEIDKLVSRRIQRDRRHRARIDRERTLTKRFRWLAG